MKLFQHAIARRAWVAPAVLHALTFLGLTVLVIALIGYEILAARTSAREAARRDVSNLALVIEAKLNLDYTAAARAVALMVEELATAPMQQDLAAARQPAMRQLLQSHLATIPSATALRVFDAEGRRLYTSSADEPTISIADHAFFQRLKRQPALGRLYSEVAVGRLTGRAAQFVVQPVLDTRGNFLGLALASIDLTALQESLQQIDIGVHGTVSLRRLDNGAQVVSLPGPPLVDNQPEPDLPVLAAIRQRGPVGTLNLAARGNRDGQGRLIAYRTVGQHPLFVSVSLADQDFLARWRERASVAAGITLGFITVLAAAFFRLTRAEARRDANERALRESEERFRRLIDLNRAPILQIDPATGHILDANAAACEFYGWPHDELCAKDIQSIHALAPQQVAAERMAAIREHRSYVVFPQRLANGQTRTVEVHSTPLEIGPQHLLVSIIHDVTERVLAAERVALLMREQQAILDSRVVGFVRVSQRRIVWVNHAFAAMLGYTPDALEGQPTRVLFTSEAAHAEFIKASELALSRGWVYRTEQVQQRADGSHGWFSVSCSALPSSGDEVIGAFVDITERKALEARLLEAKTEIEDLYDNAPCGYCSLDVQGRILRINATGLSWLGCSLEQVLGRPITDFFTPDGQNEFRRRFPHMLAEGHVENLDLDLLGSRGMRRVSISATALKNEGGAFVSSRCVMFDVAELHRSRQSLARLSLEQQAMLDNDLIGIIKVHERSIVWANKGMRRLFGYAPDELTHQASRLLHPDDEAYAAFAEAANLALSGRGRYRTQTEMLRRDGRRIWVDISGTLLAKEGHESLWLLADLTSIRAQQEQTEFFAFHDDLTGLPNRMLLNDRLTQAIALAKRHGHRFALCFLDLDGFKAVNDRHGHTAGDRLLQEIARRLQAVVRATDLVCRLGGDEFVLLLAEPESLAGHQAVLQRVLDDVAQPVDIDHGVQGRVTASIGVALFPDAGDDVDTLLGHADEAMYRAKGLGRNQICVYQP